jgi:hypothetical protein
MQPDAITGSDELSAVKEKEQDAIEETFKGLFAGVNMQYQIFASVQHLRRPGYASRHLQTRTNLRNTTAAACVNLFMLSSSLRAATSLL